MASYVAAYRIGMLASTAGALFVVSGFQSFGLDHHAAWSAGYVVMAGFVLIGIVTTLAATEPEKSAAAESAHARENALERVIEAAVGAFSEFLSRDMAFVALAFVVLFKFTDALSGAMTSPFVIDLGFSRNEYAAIIKGVGLAATLDRRLCRRVRGARLFATDEPPALAVSFRRSPIWRSPGRPSSA